MHQPLFFWFASSFTFNTFLCSFDCQTWPSADCLRVHTLSIYRYTCIRLSISIYASMDRYISTSLPTMSGSKRREINCHSVFLLWKKWMRRRADHPCWQCKSRRICNWSYNCILPRERDGRLKKNKKRRDHRGERHGRSTSEAATAQTLICTNSYRTAISNSDNAHLFSWFSQFFFSF